MKHVSCVLSLLVCVAVAFVAYADTDWVSAREVEEKVGMKFDGVTGKRGYWAGSVEEVELTFYDDGSVKTTGRLKIKITWVTDRTNYQCHSIYIMNEGDLKDFTYRSLALRKCE